MGSSAGKAQQTDPGGGDCRPPGGAGMDANSHAANPSPHSHSQQGKGKGQGKGRGVSQGPAPTPPAAPPQGPARRAPSLEPLEDRATPTVVEIKCSRCQAYNWTTRSVCRSCQTPLARPQGVCNAATQSAPASAKASGTVPGKSYVQAAAGVVRRKANQCFCSTRKPSPKFSANFRTAEAPLRLERTGFWGLLWPSRGSFRASHLNTNVCR